MPASRSKSVVRLLLPAALALLSACGGGGGKDSGPTAPPAPVLTTLTVTLSPATIQVGQTGATAAAGLDQNGASISLGAVTWSSSAPAVASISSAGAITAISAGQAQITASSGGKSGQSTLTVISVPIATVAINGSLLTKVGDIYAYSATARLADGTVVIRPVTWSILETAKGTMSPTGSFTPSDTGSITIQASIDGTTWVGRIRAYDWVSFASGGSLFVDLNSDTPITNNYGKSEYPSLVIACSPASSFFALWVSFTNFITSSGTVAYSFDGGTISSATWTELSPSYSTLWHPGPPSLTKAFAVTVAGARTFGFAFTEFLGPARAMIFRVTGLGPRLAPIIAACPAAAVLADAVTARSELSSELGPNESVSAELMAARQERQLRGPAVAPVPALNLEVPAKNSQQAVRRP
jgi:hypothetical protein